MPQAKPSILVVDDERDTCANLQDILSDLGYRVDVAYDGPSALHLVEQHPYDIALLDLKMPGMDGLELYRRIKRMRAGTVAILVTAYAASETAQAATDAGAWRIMPKPVDFGQLHQLIEQAAEQPLLLVVDDDPELCDSLWDLFRGEGYRVSLAHGAEQAERCIRDRAYHVVLIDMKLPDKDGGEVYRMLRARSPESRCVVITGDRGEMADTIDRILAEGASGVCYKPFDVGQLIKQVRLLVQ